MCMDAFCFLIPVCILRAHACAQVLSIRSIGCISHRHMGVLVILEFFAMMCCSISPPCCTTAGLQRQLRARFIPQLKVSHCTQLNRKHMEIWHAAVDVQLQICCNTIGMVQQYRFE